MQPLPRPPEGPGRVVATISVLEGTVRMPGVEVELKTAGEKMTLAKTITDGAGQVSFPDVPPGRYFISATRPGFVSQDSAQFDVRSGETAHVLLDINLAFTVPPVEVRGSSPVEPPEPVPPLEPTPEPLESLTLQPVSASDMLSGSLLDVAPLEGDDFQSLLPLLPGVVRGADGRLRIKGGHPTQGALQISSASLIDPSSGDFDLDLPGQSVESVEVMANPFAAEYGRFSTSITQVRTRRGTNEWEIKPGNLMPRFRKGLTRHPGIRAAILRARSAQAGSAVPRAGLSVSVRQHTGEESARRAGGKADQLRFVHARRQRAVDAAYHRRRRDSVPARDPSG